MNWLAFFSSIVNSIIWPVTIIITILLLKTPITKLITNIIKLKYKDFEINFSDELDQVESKISLDETTKTTTSEENKVSEPNGSYGLKEFDERFRKIESIARIEPYLAVIYSWIEIEAKLKSMVESQGLTTNVNKMNIRILLESLSKSIIVTKELYNLVIDLNVLRNKAVHSGLYWIWSYGNLLFFFQENLK